MDPPCPMFPEGFEVASSPKPPLPGGGPLGILTVGTGEAGGLGWAALGSGIGATCGIGAAAGGGANDGVGACGGGGESGDSGTFRSSAPAITGPAGGLPRRPARIDDSFGGAGSAIGVSGTSARGASGGTCAPPCGTLSPASCSGFCRRRLSENPPPAAVGFTQNGHLPLRGRSWLHFGHLGILWAPSSNT